MFHVSATRDLAWLAVRTGWTLSGSARAIEAREERTGRTVGMVAFDGWTNNGGYAHIALDAPIALRRLLGPAFRYFFVDSGKGVLLTQVASTNARSIALMAALGFRETCRIADAVSVGVAAVLFAMRRNECRFLEG